MVKKIHERISELAPQDARESEFHPSVAALNQDPRYPGSAPGQSMLLSEDVLRGLLNINGSMRQQDEHQNNDQWRLVLEQLRRMEGKEDLQRQKSQWADQAGHHHRQQQNYQDRYARPMQDEYEFGNRPETFGEHPGQAAYGRQAGTHYQQTNQMSGNHPMWTRDGRPICYICMRPGHLARSCPDNPYCRQEYQHQPKVGRIKVKRRRQRRATTRNARRRDAANNTSDMPQCVGGQTERDADDRSHSPHETESSGLVVNGKLCGVDIVILVDTGADVSLINKALLQKTPFYKSIDTECEEDAICTLGGNEVSIVGSAEISLEIGQKMYKLTTYAIDDLDPDIMLGKDFLSEHNAIINLGTNTLEIPHSNKVKLGNRASPLKTVAACTLASSARVQHDNQHENGKEKPAPSVTISKALACTKPSKDKKENKAQQVPGQKERRKQKAERKLF